jgi:hypothetical protein
LTARLFTTARFKRSGYLAHPILRRRHGEHYMKIGKQVALAISEPLGSGKTLALWAVPVATGIVVDAGLAAVLPALDMAAERRCPAHVDRRLTPRCPEVSLSP